MKENLLKREIVLLHISTSMLHLNILAKSFDLPLEVKFSPKEDHPEFKHFSKMFNVEKPGEKNE